MRSLLKKFSKENEVKLTIASGNSYRDIECIVESEYTKGKNVFYLLRSKSMNVLGNFLYYTADENYLSYCNSDNEKPESKYYKATEYLPEVLKNVLISTGGRYEVKNLHIEKFTLPELRIGPRKYENISGYGLTWNSLHLSNVKSWIEIPKEDTNV